MLTRMYTIVYMRYLVVWTFAEDAWPLHVSGFFCLRAFSALAPPSAVDRVACRRQFESLVGFVLSSTSPKRHSGIS